MMRMPSSLGTYYSGKVQTFAPTLVLMKKHCTKCVHSPLLQFISGFRITYHLGVQRTMLKCLMLIHFKKLNIAHNQSMFDEYFAKKLHYIALYAYFMLICFDSFEWSIRCTSTCLLCTKVTSKH